MKSIKYTGYKPASARASAAAKGASRQKDTKPEKILSRALWHSGLRYRKNVSNLPGKPDIVFKSAKLVVFCDGDFWHGKNWKRKKEKMKVGHNASYWVLKIERNKKKKKINTERLESEGWTVMRFWESEIYDELERVVAEINRIIDKKLR